MSRGVSTVSVRFPGDRIKAASDAVSMRVKGPKFLLKRGIESGIILPLRGVSNT